MKGQCKIPMNDRIRGSRAQTNQHRFTREELVRAGRATAGKTLTREARVNGGLKGGRATGVNKRFGAHKRWHRDRVNDSCPFCFVEWMLRKFSSN